MEAIVDSLDLYRTQLFDNKKTGTQIVDTLLSYNMTRDDMMETLVETVFTGSESTVALDTKTKGAITREYKKRDIGEAVRSATGDDDPVSDLESDVELDY